MEQSTSYGALGLMTPTTQVRGGDTIRGEAVLTVRKEVKFSGLQVAFTGKEKTEVITVQRTHAKHHAHKRRVRHFARSTLCNVGTSFVPAALEGTFDGKWYTAAVGQYRVPFEFVLPRMLPQSATVAGSRHSAKNYYYLKTTLVTKGGSILSSVKSAVGLNAVKMPITVLPGLQAPEGYDTPATKTKEKSFLCSRSSAKLKASVTVPERAFYAGQQVPISILVENPTNKIVKKVSVSLRAKRRVKAARHTMNCSITVAKSVEVLTLGKHGHRSVELLLTLPEHLYLHSFEAPHWRMRYQVVVKLHSTGLTTKTVVRIPLWVMGPLEAVPGKLAQEYGMFEAPPSYDEAASVSVSMHAAVRL